MNTAAAAPPTFVFADLAGYTALNEAHGDEGGASTASRFFEITRREQALAQFDPAEFAATADDVITDVEQRSERTGDPGIPPRLRSLAKLRESRAPRTHKGDSRHSQLLRTTPPRRLSRTRGCVNGMANHHRVAYARPQFVYSLIDRREFILTTSTQW